jgi:hypothetical protein
VKTEDSGIELHKAVARADFARARELLTVFAAEISAQMGGPEARHALAGAAALLAELRQVTSAHRAHLKNRLQQALPARAKWRRGRVRAIG